MCTQCELLFIIFSSHRPLCIFKLLLAWFIGWAFSLFLYLIIWSLFFFFSFIVYCQHTDNNTFLMLDLAIADVAVRKRHQRLHEIMIYFLPALLVFVKDSILGNWPKNRARSASTSTEGARVRRRQKASVASLSPEAQEIPRSGIESLLLWPNSYRLQVTLPVKIGYAPSQRSTDLLPKFTQQAAIASTAWRPCCLSPGIGYEFQKMSPSCMLILDIDLGPTMYLACMTMELEAI